MSMGQLIKKALFFFSIFSMATTFFLVVLFPLNDISDLVTSEVAKGSNNQVYFQFDSLSLSPVPPGLRMDKVQVESAQMAGLKADEVVVRPSISGLLRGLPYGSLEANGFLRGHLNVKVGSGEPAEGGQSRSRIELAAQKISLRDLRGLIGLPVPLQGNLDIQSQALADFTFQAQPEGDLEVAIARFELPPSSVQTMMGPLTLPEVKLGQVNLKGRLSRGTFTIEQGDFGKTGDELQLSLKGTLQITLQNLGGQIVPIIGGYNLDVDLRTQPGFQQRAGLFLSFVQSHQKSPGQYRFKIAAQSMNLPPQISTLR
ncbi:MAG: type II secretion system protein GspN [Bdellovibrionales bacterium]